MNHPSVRPLDAAGTSIILALCLCWGFNQVAVKLAIDDIPPVTQSAIRSIGATIALNRAAYEKTLLYQLVVSGVLLAVAAAAFGERITAVPSAVALGALAYQTVLVSGISYLAWFALIQRYSASRLAAFTFLTPLFGVAAGHFMLQEPLTPAFVAAAAMVVGGLVLVNRPHRSR